MTLTQIRRHTYGLHQKFLNLIFTMTLNTNHLNQSAKPADWSTFYTNLQSKGRIPDASEWQISRNHAVFRGMYQDLSAIQNELSQSGQMPTLITVYADVLNIPEQTNWVLKSSGLVIYARRIEVGANASITIDCQQASSTRLLVFSKEIEGTLSVKAIADESDQSNTFNINQASMTVGFSISCQNGVAVNRPMALSQGMGMQLTADMQLYLNNAFICASLLYDQNQAVALAIFLWVKDWAAQTTELEELFFRSASLSTLLTSEINASSNGARFAPYLTANVYTDLAKAFSASAEEYERNYMQLSGQNVLTDQGIALAKTMVSNTDSEVAYVNALLKQANENYQNAEAAVEKAKINFSRQKIVVEDAAAKFQHIGIPDFERQQIFKAILSMVSAIITFGGAMALATVGAPTPAAAEGALNGVQDVANGISELADSELVKLASTLANAMKDLKKIVEMMEKIYKLAQSIKLVADNIKNASKDQMQSIQKIDGITDGVDLSAADSWAVFNIQVENVMQKPIELGIGYAQQYKEAMDILAVYGQSILAAQLAVIKASQQVAALTFQRHYAQQKQENLQSLVNHLSVGQAPTKLMMQQFYQKYLDSKSSLFTAFKAYQGSYFYWAFRESAVAPQIIDPVTNLNAGIQDITRIAMDKTNALSEFNPPPQEMENILFEITDPQILKTLQTTGKASWVIPLNDPNFVGLERVRLSNIRVWLEGTQFTQSSRSVFITLTTSGNYLDRFKQTNYQFSSKPLTRSFKYEVRPHGSHHDWQFEDGSYGFIQVDGEVDKEVAYAYFQPTPFSEWHISLLSNNPGLDFAHISKVTMYLEGTTIGASATRSLTNTAMQEVHAHA